MSKKFVWRRKTRFEEWLKGEDEKQTILKVEKEKDEEEETRAR